MSVGAQAQHARGPWPTLARVAQVVLTVLVIVLVFLAVALAVFIHRAPNGETTILGRPVYSVVSGSMTPTFDTGDLIVDSPISAAAAAHLHKGQIITFSTSAPAGGTSIIVTHRIFAVEPGSATAPVMYRTKGDANKTPDQGLVAPSAILGTYQGFRIPFGGYVLSTLHQPLTFVILIMIPVVYIAVVEIRRRWIALGVADAERKRLQMAGSSPSRDGN